MSTEEQEAKVIDDQGPTATTGPSKVIKGEVVTVITIEKYKSCRNCKVKVAPDSNAALASAVQN